MTDERNLDCRGLACPQPVLDTKEALEQGPSPLTVLVDNEGACTNVTRFAESRGARVTVEQRGGDFALRIEPGDHQPDGDDPPIVCDTDPAGRIAVYVNSATMGRGDDALGEVLMKAFLDTLSEFKGQIGAAAFVNGGARLAVEGSPVLGQIKQLEELGVDVLVCGTCLNHFGIKDRLAVGRVSNMYEILETLTGASRILTP